MNFEAFITCAVTGSGATAEKSDLVPRSPREIADACVEAREAGAAIVHCHVRDPDTGVASRDIALYRELVEHLRDSDTDAVLNLTTGMGGDLYVGPPDAPLPLSARTDMASAQERVEHILELKPEICTLDCGTMNFAESDYVMTNTLSQLRAMAALIKKAGTRPEVEIFDTGHLVLAKQLEAEGLLEQPVLAQLCMGIPYGAPADLSTLVALKTNVPEEWVCSGFAIGRMSLPYVSAALLANCHVRVGLEDNLYLKKGVLASNAQLVARAKTIMEAMGVRVLEPAEVRERLKIKKRW